MPEGVPGRRRTATGQWAKGGSKQPDSGYGPLVGDSPSALPQSPSSAPPSPSHFTRVFRASTGQSPHQYLVRLRLERARRALLTTDTPIAAIAQLCGFADQSHLTRTMRLHSGLTPAGLRSGR
ncbi:helix-turn-helix domain-containing protein [Kitasatospora sp. NPDC017646]|uniref:helix-turn-helix domain-containing protein n=1 Tax=Kitasatospora sp. NPDC017646 TaxID=3364024 RepID=UPI00378E6B3F